MKYLICFFWGLGLFAFKVGPSQVPPVVNGITTNLFEYGVPVIEAADNMRNLFENFPKYVENGEDIVFISYEHVGTIRRESEARKFVRNNFNMNPQFGWATVFYKNKVDILQDIPSSARFHVDNYSLSLLGKKAINNMINTISEEYIHVGDEIFAIEYIIELQKYRYYVFINSTTKKVLPEGNIFAFEFPMTHIEYIDGRKDILDDSEYFEK